MEKLKYTKVCLGCGLVLADSVKFCNKCGNHVETARCPVCRKATNPLEALCNNCNSNVYDLVNADLSKSSAVLRQMQKSESFKQIQANDQMLRLAYLDSIIGSATVYAFEIASKRQGEYKRTALFVYDESSPDDWEKPNTWYNPRDKYSSKQEYIEAIREKSKRPDFGFFAWFTIYAKMGKDIYAYKLCLLLSNLYSSLGMLFDDAGFIVSECGVELQHQAYELLCIAQHNPQGDYWRDSIAKTLFSNVRYKLARLYFAIEYFGFADLDEEGKHTSISKYYANYNGGYKKVLDIISSPLPEDQTHTKLLRGLMNFNFNNNPLFIDSWNVACNDSSYINSQRDYIDDCIFALSAIFMSSIARQNNNIDAAISILKFALSNIIRKHWAEVLMEEFSKYKQDNYGNIVYVE